MTEENNEEVVKEVQTETTTTDTETTDVETEERILAVGDTPEFEWFVAHALSGFENRVTKTLKERIINYEMTDSFAEILVPEEEVMKTVNGKQRRYKKKFFPGYVLIKMIMNDKTWHLVKNTDKITGFLGGTAGRPTPIPEEEAAYMTGKGEEGLRKQKTTYNFTEGESVKVTEGPFTSFVGTIEKVSDKGKLRVNVSIFGRATPVELDSTQVEKV